MLVVVVLLLQLMSAFDGAQLLLDVRGLFLDGLLLRLPTTLFGLALANVSSPVVNSIRV
jgi:hypothetical protein